MMRLMGWIVATALACLGGSATAGEDAPVPLMAWSAPSPLGEGRIATPSHAWIVTPDADGRVSLVWHVPPRGGRLFLGSPPGAVRLAADIPAIPVAAAAVGERLYLVFEERKAMPDGSPRQVLSLDAVPAGELGGEINWVTRPAGRLDAAASLRGDGRLIDLSGGRLLHALMHGLRDHGADPTRVHLLAMMDAQWREVALSPDLIEQSRRGTHRQGNRVWLEAPWRLVSMPDGVAIATLEGGQLLVWMGAHDRSDAKAIGARETAPTASAGLAYGWSLRRLGNPSADPSRMPRLLADGHDLVAVDDGDDGRWRVWRLDGDATQPQGGRWELACDVAVAPADAGRVQAVGMAGVAAGDLMAPGVLLVAEAAGETRAPSLSLGSGRVLGELSLATGSVLSLAPLAPRNPVSAADYRLMGVLLLIVLGTVVVFLARPPGFEATPVTLPRHTCLADPLRRLFAGAIDLLIACVIGTAAWGLPVRVLATAEWWGGGGSMTVLATVLVLLVLQGGVSEWLFGRTPGKLMTGCAVIGARPHPESGMPMGLGLSRAMVRNMLKWLAPLVAIVGLLDPSRRHRGDQWSGSVVVERLPDDAED